MSKMSISYFSVVLIRHVAKAKYRGRLYLTDDPGRIRVHYGWEAWQPVREAGCSKLRCLNCEHEREAKRANWE